VKPGPDLRVLGGVLSLLLWLSPAAAAAPESPVVPEALPAAEPFSKALREQLSAVLAARGPSYVPRTRHRHGDGSPIYSNRLLLETSPYLQQHSHNPVNWYPWGDEAFETAARLGRPVLVSIGYSTCHWCHVMEEESFDDPETAMLMNAYFVAIKVDREARPDVDSIYMSALSAMGQNGGWPLNVWLTPDRKPFYGGTYFPREDRGGRPGFRKVLRAIHEQYTLDPQGFGRRADEVSEAVARRLTGVQAEESRLPGAAALQTAAALYGRHFDETWGGLNQRMKFPSSLSVRFLFAYHRRSGDAQALKMATLTLEKMAAGGIHDHLGGGFHRYATDPRWLVPHFEKMLYDNAQLAIAYLEGWQVTGREAFAVVARSILDYVAREMTAPGGGFYSATDADSLDPEGELEEGRFFTWTPAEIEDALGETEAPLAIAWYGVEPVGPVEGRSALHTWQSAQAQAERFGIEKAELETRIAAARERLFEVRAKRPPPARDEKILAAWNGLMISAFARAGLALGNRRYVELASSAAEHLLEDMRTEGRLRRVSMEGQSAGPAFLEDYAFVIAGLLDLYEAAPDPRWLREAKALQRVLDSHYADEAGGGYFRTADDHETLLAREKPGHDGALPSGNSVAASNLLRLAALTTEDAYRERAALLFSAFYDTLMETPSALSNMLLALDFELDVAKEVLIVKPEGGDAAALLDVLRASYVPNRVLSVVTEGEELRSHAELVPLLERKVARDGKATAYVCENRVCRFPTSDPARFASELGRVEPIEPPDVPGTAAARER
jgi:uncharacterized protein YyaL (SSP411 family)